ncbi:MAG: hypothetical protein MSIBF_04850 [Candidatus Altiarchaeales archaeon IMC4]|nr:MAG: hypothetical protein MSIBF_04850 [Candidatus Altiarchaeales archaeon IMC4]
MTFLERIKRVLLLDQGVYREVRDDKAALLQGVAIVLAAGFLGAVGSIIASYIPNDFINEIFGPLLGLFDLILLPLVFLICLPITTLIAHIPAKLLGGKSSYMGFLRSIAFTDAPGIFSVIPVIGAIIATIWSFICYILAIRSAHELSWGKTAAVVIISIVLLVILVVLLAILVGILYYMLETVSI